MAKTEHKKANFKILIIDDSSISTSRISESLNEVGYQAIESSNSPSEGFQMATSDDFHLYIIDVVMPKVSGIEIAKEISAKEENSCILMISSLDSENILIESIASGANDFLVKPLDKQQITNSVDKLYEYAIKAKIF